MSGADCALREQERLRVCILGDPRQLLYLISRTCPAHPVPSPTPPSQTPPVILRSHPLHQFLQTRSIFFRPTSHRFNRLFHPGPSIASLSSVRDDPSTSCPPNTSHISKTSNLFASERTWWPPVRSLLRDKQNSHPTYPRRSHGTVASHIKIRNAPVPWPIADLGNSSPPSENLSIRSTKRAG